MDKQGAYSTIKLFSENVMLFLLMNIFQMISVAATTMAAKIFYILLKYIISLFAETLKINIQS